MDSKDLLKETEDADEARQEVQHPLSNQTLVEWNSKQDELSKKNVKEDPAPCGVASMT